MPANPRKAVRQLLHKREEKEFLRRASNEEIFSRIYQLNKWGDEDTRSGKGSNLSRTIELRKQLPLLVQRFDIRTLLDIPCGDFYWMKETRLELDAYIGADIVDSLVENNVRKFSTIKQQFRKLNLLNDKLPTADALLCRECLVHFSFRDIDQAIENIMQSNCGLLLTTSFPDIKHNEDILTGKHRPLNFRQPPFNWPTPKAELVESYCNRRGRKILAVWNIADLS